MPHVCICCVLDSACTITLWLKHEACADACGCVWGKLRGDGNSCVRTARHFVKVVASQMCLLCMPIHLPMLTPAGWTVLFCLASTHPAHKASTALSKKRRSPQMHLTSVRCLRCGCVGITCTETSVTASILQNVGSASSLAS